VARHHADAVRASNGFKKSLELLSKARICEIEMPNRFELVHPSLLKNFYGALKSAQTHAVYYDPGREHWGNIATLCTAYAAEMLFKAMIAEKHPLLLFQNIFDLDRTDCTPISIDTLLAKGKTHSLEKLPQVLWAVCEIELPDKQSFDELRKLRNSIQHFFHPAGSEDFGKTARDICIDFIYKNLDPLLNTHFQDHCILHIEDEFPDYLIRLLILSEHKFSFPPCLCLTEIDIEGSLKQTSKEYQTWFSENSTIE
jgi:hypothetical protein